MKSPGRRTILKKFTFALSVALFLLVASENGRGQQVTASPVPQSNPAPRVEHSRPAAVEKSKAGDVTNEAVAERRKVRLTRVHGLAEAMINFREPTTKAQDLSRLALLVWHDEEAFARQLFQRALDASSPTSDLSAAQAKRLLSARRRVITMIAQMDSAWARRLISELQTREANFQVAYDLLENDPQKAAEFGQRSLGSGISPGMYSLLLRLRARDEGAANALFLSTLGQLAAEPNFDPKTLMFLGTYLFTSPNLDSSEVDMIAMTLVGHVIVPGITADRPGMSPALIRAYLEVAGSLLIRPLSDPEQQQWAYVAAYSLLPKAQRFSPDLAPQFSAAMAGLSGNVPQEYTKDATFKYLEPVPPRSLNQQLEEIEKLPLEIQRDARYMDLISTLCRNKDWRQAREVLAKISDLELNAKLTTLINFGVGIQLLETADKLSEAESLANKMPEGIERAVLCLAVAQAIGKTGDRSHTLEALNAAIRSGRKVDDARRPFIILNAAGQLARLNIDLGQSALTEAIREFNKVKPDDLAKVSWQERVDVGGGWRYFPLAAKELNFGFETCWRPFVELDLEGSINRGNQLSDETQRGDALLAIAATLMRASNLR